MMDAVSATIFDGVQAIRKTRVVVELIYLSGYFIVLY
jgi:isocitrate lyase